MRRKRARILIPRSPCVPTIPNYGSRAVCSTSRRTAPPKRKRISRQRLRPRPEYTLLNTAPGIGRILAPIILLETGSIERFAAVGNYASYARCVDSVRLSNGKKKGEGNVRNGNKYLAWAFIEAANMARRWCPEARRFHDRKRAKTNAIVATKALAHKLARACYHMLRTGEPFDMKRCFG